MTTDRQPQHAQYFPDNLDGIENKETQFNLVVKHEKCSIEEVVDGVKTHYFYSDCYNNRMLCC
jgi:hypothetical protein